MNDLTPNERRMLLEVYKIYLSFWKRFLKSNIRWQSKFENGKYVKRGPAESLKRDMKGGHFYSFNQFVDLMRTAREYDATLDRDKRYKLPPPYNWCRCLEIGAGHWNSIQIFFTLAGEIHVMKHRSYTLLGVKGPHALPYLAPAARVIYDVKEKHIEYAYKVQTASKISIDKKGVIREEYSRKTRHIYLRPKALQPNLKMIL
jgi:hypothetical protein